MYVCIVCITSNSQQLSKEHTIEWAVTLEQSRMEPNTPPLSPLPPPTPPPPPQSPPQPPPIPQPQTYHA